MPMTNYEPFYDYKVPEAVFPEPLKLYEKDPDYVQQPFWTYRGLWYGFSVGMISSIIGLGMARRPLHANKYKTLGFSFGCAAVFYGGQKIGERYNMFRDQVYKHYIMLHPEDFPAPERKKWGEKWEIFIPVRSI